MKRYLLPGVLLGLSITASMGVEQVLVQEDFEQATETSTAKDGTKKVAWFAEVGASLNVVGDSTLATGKAFQGNKIVGIIPDVPLDDVGDTMTVTFDFRVVSPVQDSDHGFLFGVFEGGDPGNPWNFSDGEGYSWKVNTGPIAAPVPVSSIAGGDGQQVLDGQSENILGQSPVETSFGTSNKHSVVMILKRTDDGMSVALSIDQGAFSYQVVDLLAPETITPNRFAIRTAPNQFLFDNFTVKTDISSGN